MNCEEAQQYIIEYVTGNFEDIPEISNLEHHIAGCEECSKMYDEYCELSIDLRLYYVILNKGTLKSKKNKIKTYRE